MIAPLAAGYCLKGNQLEAAFIVVGAVNLISYLEV
jgi:hypothetical protein